MKRMNYPGFSEHQIEHFELLEKFNLAKFKNCNFEEFHLFLKEWFLNHTVESDIKLKLYMLENNINLEDYFYELKI
jgi:hemerythrin